MQLEGFLFISLKLVKDQKKEKDYGDKTQKNYRGEKQFYSFDFGAVQVPHYWP